ncbi:extracellular solute-binding protein [Candidatus Gracilibacteria bacterium]|nr:extracellular solute-binding protein [Candidatus Gracilibacteria bacterium]
MRKPSFRRLTTRLVLALISALLFSACGSAPAAPPAGDGAAPASDANAPITVWVDSTREAAVKLYQEKHPENADKITIEIADRAQFPAKVLLFNNTGSGWPDVVFAEPEIVGQVADTSRNFPADLTPYVSQDILSQFAEGANAPCTFDGKLFCLRNDLAHNVLWYNKPLMDEFGYSVPTTWEEYAALGERVAAEHPGYVIGAFGDDQALNVYFWASQCPVNQLVDANTVRINLSDAKCTRVAAMMDSLIANGAVSTLGPFDPAFAALAADNKILMLPAASWYGEYVFGGKADSTYYKEANGQLSVAPPLKWEGDERAFTGAQGGAAWAMSRHTKNPQLAADLIVWLTTSTDYQGTAPTFPAFLPAADAWSKTVSGNSLYASDPFPVLKESSELIDPQWANVRFDKSSAFNTVVIAAVTNGQTVASALPEFQSQLSALAQAAGYQVVNE